MSTALLEVEDQWTVLRSKAEHVGELVSSPLTPHAQTSAPVGDEVAAACAEKRSAWYREVEKCVIDLSKAMPEGAEDYDVRKLFELLFELRNAIESDPEGTDATGKVELAKIEMGDVAHRVGRRLLHGQLDDPRAAADYVLETLKGVGVEEVARLLGVSTKTINAWRAGRPVARNVRRVVTVAQLLAYLRASMTPRGLVMWFDATREQLGGRTPLQMLDEDEASAREALIELARGARGQLAD